MSARPQPYNGAMVPPEDAVRVLIVEDDRHLRSMLAEIFAEEGYAVTPAADGQQGLHLTLTQSFDAVVLDRGLPVLDGLDLLARIRSSGVETPVLILSALGNPADRVDGLDSGAEDYLTKPFDIGELLARMRALLRRHRDTARTLVLPRQLRLHVDALEAVDAEGGSITLSRGECRLLEVLAREPGRVIERQALLRSVFPEAIDLGVVDTYVHYVRRKLGRDVIVTVRGVGYRLGST